MTKQREDVNSFSELKIHFRFVQFLNLWLNLCSFTWLNPSFNLVRNFMPTGLWILNAELGTGLNSSWSVFWRMCKINSEFADLFLIGIHSIQG